MSHSLSSMCYKIKQKTVIHQCMIQRLLTSWPWTCATICENCAPRLFQYSSSSCGPLESFSLRSCWLSISTYWERNTRKCKIPKYCTQGPKILRGPFFYFVLCCKLYIQGVLFQIWQKNNTNSWYFLEGKYSWFLHVCFIPGLGIFCPSVCVTAIKLTHHNIISSAVIYPLFPR